MTTTVPLAIEPVNSKLTIPILVLTSRHPGGLFARYGLPVAEVERLKIGEREWKKLSDEQMRALRGLSTGDFQPALVSLLGERASGLSSTPIVLLTTAWEAD